MRILLAAAAALLLPLGASAQEPSSTPRVRLQGGFSFGYANPPTTDTGLALTGWFGQEGKWWRWNLLADAIMSEDEDSPYYTDGNGCRNSENGQFADKSLCSPEIDPALRGEVVLRVPGSGVTIGPGIRVFDGVAPYGTAGYESPVTGFGYFQLRVSLGERYSQFDIGFAL